MGPVNKYGCMPSDASNATNGSTNAEGMRLRDDSGHSKLEQNFPILIPSYRKSAESGDNLSSVCYMETYFSCEVPAYWVRHLIEYHFTNLAPVCFPLYYDLFCSQADINHCTVISISLPNNNYLYL
jgi:hypothetical protein